MNPIFKGLLIGLGTAFVVGPVFFTLLKNSIQGTKFNGFLTAFGILISDILVALICLLFSREFLSLINHLHPYTYLTQKALHEEGFFLKKLRMDKRSSLQFQFLNSLQSRNSSYCHLLRHLMTKTSLWLLLF